MRAVCGLARQSMLCKMHEVCPRVCNVFVCVCEVCGLNGARVPTTGARPRRSGAGARSGTLDFRFRRAPCWRGSVRSKRAVCIRPRGGAPGEARGGGASRRSKRYFEAFEEVILRISLLDPQRADRAAVQSRVAIQ